MLLADDDNDEEDEEKELGGCDDDEVGMGSSFRFFSNVMDSMAIRRDSFSMTSCACSLRISKADRLRMASNMSCTSVLPWVCGALTALEEAEDELELELALELELLLDA